MRPKIYEKGWFWPVLFIVAIVGMIAFHSWKTITDKKATKAVIESTDRAAVASADAAEPISFASGAALYRHKDREANVICYFVVATDSWDVGGVHCIPAKDLTDRGRDFLLNY